MCRGASLLIGVSLYSLLFIGASMFIGAGLARCLMVVVFQLGVGLVCCLMVLAC